MRSEAPRQNRPLSTPAPQQAPASPLSGGLQTPGLRHLEASLNGSPTVQRLQALSGMLGQGGLPVVQLAKNGNDSQSEKSDDEEEKKDEGFKIVEEEPPTKKKGRRKASEIERSHECPEVDCGKKYGTSAALYQHIKLKHRKKEEIEGGDSLNGDGDKKRRQKRKETDFAKIEKKDTKKSKSEMVMKTYGLNEIGDSDEDSESEGEYDYNIEKAMRSRYTTIRTKPEGDKRNNFKGHEILRSMNDSIKRNISESKKIDDEGKDEGGEGLKIRSGPDWLRTAGMLSITALKGDAMQSTNERKEDLKKRAISTGMGKKSEKQNKKIIEIGEGKTGVLVKFYSGATERLVFDEDAQGKGDEYGDVIKKIDGFKVLFGLDDQQIAGMILDKLKRGTKNKNKNLDDYLNYMLALIVGVEGSRNNRTFASAPMALELIATGRLNFRDAFGKDKFGGIYPMASNKSGRGNLTKERQLIEDQKVTGFREVRSTPQHSQVSLKEALVAKLWFKSRIGNTRDLPKEQAEKAFSQELEKMMKFYYGGDEKDQEELEEESEWFADGEEVNYAGQLNGNLANQNFTVSDTDSTNNNCLINAILQGTNHQLLEAGTIRAMLRAQNTPGVRGGNFLENTAPIVGGILQIIGANVAIQWWRRGNGGALEPAGMHPAGNGAGQTINIVNVGGNHFQLLIPRQGGGQPNAGSQN